MAKENATTPLMEQYLAIKARYQDAVLFFRMGDFYEMFYDDARVASEVLGLTLTSRAHGKAAEVPLAGFPYHALDTYLAKLIKAGYRVAICEQLEDPKQAKTVVKRDVVEVVTPGTAFSDELLDSKRNNFLAAVVFAGTTAGLASADVSTGEFQVVELPAQRLFDELLAIGPREVLIPEEQVPAFEDLIEGPLPFALTKREGWIFSRDYGYELLTDHFKTLSLKGFGCEDLHAGIGAAGAILHYLKETQRSEPVHITRLVRRSESDHLLIDATTRRNLELLQPLRPENRDGTLVAVIDRTKTAMGGRLLVDMLLRPLTQPQRIRRRLDAVEEFFLDEDRRKRLRDLLGRVGDLERLVAKVGSGRATGRDLNALKDTLRLVPQVREVLENAEAAAIRELRQRLNDLDGLASEIEQALVDDPPLSVTDGGLIRRGYNAELDHLREIAYSGKDWIARLQAEERQRTGIPSLKVGYNRVFGYYIEVTKPHLSKVPQHYVRKQTLVNAERFITPELKEYEERILDAEEKSMVLEYELFDALRKRVAGHSCDIQENARALARLDCLSALAQLAAENRYAKPEITTDDEIVIEEGRHPVVEKLLPTGERFVPNDTRMSNGSDQILIITGPNMAGKSTYLRQVGLIVLLAQMGSFVPAKRARIGVVDKIFTRVGAADNLAGGESTFLVEMNETANILNNATPRSLIILDEIGRGTSTFDGLSIAWAVAEYLHNHPKVAAKTLFATHYHELTELALILPRVKNYNIAVKEWGDHVVFLRKIVEGGCDHSYGIQVAQLAGLPAAVVRRAKEVLSNLESEALTPHRVPKLARHHSNGQPAPPAQLDIFQEQEHRLRQKIAAVDINNTTPLQALNLLASLKKLLNGES